jgi:23S rRNA pseudouridine1911/1915/1917 synthase
VATFLKQGKFIISTDHPESGIGMGIEDLSDAGPDFELRKIEVPEALHGQRVDVVLANQIPEFSRSYLQQLIDAGLVRLRGVAAAKPSTKVRVGDAISIELRPTPQTQAFRPESMALDVVHEDADVLVLNKPAGLVVHPAPGNWSGTLLNGLLARDPGAALLPRAGIVHRLDKDTSGLMVVARTRQSMDRLVQAIGARLIRRQYLAIGHHCWCGDDIVQVDAPVGRDPRNRLRMAVVDLNHHPGKTASTSVRPLGNGNACCLVECTLQTGRTHQIRVHMASLGHPLLGDLLYGGAPLAGLQRQALHAYRLAFEHPTSRRMLSFSAQLPLDMVNAMDALGLRYNQSTE